MDFEFLAQRIEDAAKKAFIEMFEKHGADGIYGFALYSDEGAMTVCPSTNTWNYLTTVDEDDLTYYKFEPCEWKYDGVGADKEINAISQQLRDALEANESMEDDGWFPQFRSQLYETCIGVLEKLKNENFFKRIVGKDIFLFFTVSDDEFETKDIENIVERLNDNEYKTEYLNWLKTWD